PGRLRRERQPASYVEVADLHAQLALDLERQPGQSLADPPQQARRLRPDEPNRVRRHDGGCVAFADVARGARSRAARADVAREARSRAARADVARGAGSRAALADVAHGARSCTARKSSRAAGA